ncbi:transposase [uncultured Clostridium sp.]|uniref:transposase n=1 Tax=uncultured Clostridium sp. TaxID=59620 RepID=UPI0025D9E74A|nr:transposase [uncultured Clostridium sp.]
MGNKRRFTKEYKEEIIKLVTEQGKRPTHVARDIGVSESTVRGWVKKYQEHGANAFPGSGNLRPEDEELRRLKKMLADIQEENEIVIAIIAYLIKIKNN